MAERLVVIGGDAGGHGRGLQRPAAAGRPRDRGLRAGHAAPATRPAASRTWWPARSTTSTSWWPARPRSSASPSASTCAPSTRSPRSTPSAARSRCATCGATAPSASGSTTWSSPPVPGPSGPTCPASTTNPCSASRPSTTPSGLLAYADACRCQRVVVVGGGYIGLEMAEAFVMWGAEVTIVDSGPHVMRTLDADMAELVARRRASACRSTLRTGVAVTGFEPGQVHTDQGPLPADLVVLGLGVEPETDAGRRGRPRARGPRGRSGSTDASRPRWRASGRPATAPSRSTWSASARCTSPWARWPTARAGWPASTSAGGYATFPGVVGTRHHPHLRHRGGAHRADPVRGRPRRLRG